MNYFNGAFDNAVIRFGKGNHTIHLRLYEDVMLWAKRIIEQGCDIHKIENVDIPKLLQWVEIECGCSKPL